jgi:general secretion pathway protein B
MSYILEALRESQKNRDGGEVPTLGSAQHDVQAVAHTPLNRRYPFLPIVTGLAVIVIGAGWWMVRDQPAPTGPATSQVDADLTEISSESLGAQSLLEKAQKRGADSREDTSTTDADKVRTEDSVEVSIMAESPPTLAERVSPEQGAVNPAADGVISPTAANRLEVPTDTPKAVLEAVEAVEAVEATEPIETVEPLETEITGVIEEDQPIGAMEIEPAIDAKVSTELRVSNQAISSDTRAGQGDSAAVTSMPIVGQPAVDNSVEIVAVPQTIAVPKSLVTPEPVRPRVPHYRELPYDVQQSLPAIVYSVHLYSPRPERRMVKIDGRIRHEGDTVSPGLVLEEITSEGAIFTFRSHTFRVPVNG